MDLKYLDVNDHPDTCSTFKPFYSVPVSLLSLLDPAWQCRHPWTKIPPKFPLPGHYDNVFPLVVTHPSTQHCFLVTTQYTGLLWCNKNVVSRTQSAPDPPLPAGLLDKEPVPHPSTLQIAFHVLLELSDSFQASQVLFRKNQSQRLSAKTQGQLSVSNLGIGNLHG